MTMLSLSISRFFVFLPGKGLGELTLRVFVSSCLAGRENHPVLGVTGTMYSPRKT